MRRSWKITGGVLAGVVVLAGAGMVVAPRLAHDRLEKALTSAGYPDARIGRVGLGLWSARVNDVALDAKGTLVISALTATWSWSGLAKGRLETLRVTGVRVVLAVGPGGPVVDPLLPRTDPSRVPAASSWPAELPVGRVDLDGTARLGDRELRVTGLTQDLGDGRAWCEMKLTADDAAITVRGQVDDGGPVGEVQWQRLPITAWAGHFITPLPERLATLPSSRSEGALRWDGRQATGTASLVGDWGHIAIQGSGNALNYAGHVVATGLDLRQMHAAARPWMAALPISALGGRIDAVVDTTWAPSAWTCAGTIEAAALAGTTPWFTLSEATVIAQGRVAAEGGGPVVVGAVRVEPADLTLTVGLPGQVVSVPSLVVTSDGRRLHAEADLHASGASLHLAASGTPDLAETSARLAVKNLDLAAWQQRLVAVLPLPTNVTGSASGTVQIEGVADVVNGRGSLAVTTLGVAGSGLQSTADAVAVEGEATLVGSDLRSAQAMVRVTGGALTAPATGVVVSAMTGTLPWSLTGLGDATGDLRADVAVAGMTLPDVRLRAQASGRTISGRIDAHLHDLITANAEGTVAVTPEGLVADLHVQVPRTTLSDPAAVAAALPMIAPWKVSGEVGLDGTIAVRRGVLVPVLHLSVAGATIEQPASKLTISGLHAGIDVVNLSPLTTAARQRIAVDRVTVGGQDMTSLAGHVTLAGDHVTLNDGIFGWGDGTVAIPTLNADLARHSAQADIQVRGVGLDAVCAVATKDRVTAEGRLVGHLPVGITWPEVTVTLGAGRLEADPPTGWIRIADRAMIAQAVGKGGTVDADLRKRLVNTVQEFAFSRLELVTSRDAGGLLTKVRVVGKGRSGPDPLELAGLVFNIRGVEEALAQALKLVQTPQAPADDTLDRFFGE